MGEAEPLLKRALEAYGAGAQAKGTSRYASKHEQSGGAVFRAERLDPRRSILAAQHRRDRRAHAARRLDTGQAVTGKKKSDAEQTSWQFRELVKAVYRLAPEGRAPDTSAARETFQTAQWAARLRGGAIAGANGGARRERASRRWRCWRASGRISWRNGESATAYEMLGWPGAG